MGVCATEQQRYKSKILENQTQEEYKVNDTEESNFYNEKKALINKYNNKKNIDSKSIEISDKSEKTIIKEIGNIKGESILIKNNIDCIILIMDYSYSINIKNCQNCSILLAPCQTLIDIRDCQNLNIISVSLNLRMYNVKDCNFFSFVSNCPIIESSEKINLGHFFIQYMELPDLFIKSKLNIWNNKWSNYKKIGKNNSAIQYSNDAIKQNIIEAFMRLFTTNFINIDQFQFLPFTYGKSFDTKNFVNFLLILKQEDFHEGELLKMLIPEEIENFRVKLISTLIVKEKSDIITNIIRKLEGNKENNILINYLLRINYNNNEDKESIYSQDEKNKKDYIPSINSTNKNRLNEFDISNNDCYTNNNNNNYKFLKKKDFLFLWFVNEIDDLRDIKDYFNSFFEPSYFGIILKEHFNSDDIEFKKYLLNIFGFN